MTRLPVWHPATIPEGAFDRRFWAFPVVGAGLGIVAGGVVAIAGSLGVPLPVCACLALATGILATGCFHEDGLADCWDGLGGGRTKERKLEIMRDSRIGSYGAAALGLSLLLRASALASLASLEAMIVALVVAGGVSRALLAVIFLSLAPARQEGLAASGDRPIGRAIALGLALGAALALLAWPWWLALSGLAFASLVVAAMAWLARRQLGGYTGDVLGASQQKAEIALLIAASTAG